MVAFIILSSLAIVLAMYALVSVRERSFVNVLTPFLFFEIPAYYVFELTHLVVFGESGSTYAYAYCYSTYTLGLIALAVGYLGFPDKPLPLLLKIPKLRIPGAPYVVLLAAVVLYLPILIEFREFITSPRQIYALTRTGYGAEFFLSTFGVYVSLILFLFSGVGGPLSAPFFAATALAMLFLHGSKGHVLSFFLIWLYFAVFVQRARFGLRRTLAAGMAVSAVVLLMFYLTMDGIGQSDLVETIADYSDYTRNAMLVIDDNDLPLQYGRLTAQASLYSLIPRAVFPDKPLDFGPLWLAHRYFPERFAANSGAPAFGIGILYADFGPFAIVYFVCSRLLVGMFMKVLVSRLRARPDAATFVLLLVMLDIPLIPAGADIPMVFYYFCALLIGALSRDRGPHLATVPHRPVYGGSVPS